MAHAFESVEELTAKERTHDFDGKQEAPASWNPAAVIGCESASRNDAVGVWMVLEFPSPSVEHGRDPELSSEPLRVSTEFEKRLGCCPK